MPVKTGIKIENERRRSSQNGKVKGNSDGVPCKPKE